MRVPQNPNRITATMPLAAVLTRAVVFKAEFTALISFTYGENLSTTVGAFTAIGPGAQIIVSLAFALVGLRVKDDEIRRAPISVGILVDIAFSFLIAENFGLRSFQSRKWFNNSQFDHNCEDVSYKCFRASLTATRSRSGWSLKNFVTEYRS